MLDLIIRWLAFLLTLVWLCPVVWLTANAIAEPRQEWREEGRRLVRQYRRNEWIKSE